MISFPWDSIVEYMDDGYPVYDRAYSAQQWRDIYQTFFSNGVFLDTNKAFQVSPGEGMTVQVAPGRCNIEGCFGVEQTIRTLELVASTSQPRIDTIVLRWDANIEARSIDLYVKQGVAAASPKRPTLTRTETVWELGLCDVYVAARVTKVEADRITDTRLDTARCGVVAPFQTVDTTTFYEQLQAAVDKAVDAMRDALDGTTAGRLEGEIEELQLNAFKYLGVNITNGAANDTPSFWKNIGPGYVLFNEMDMLSSQPIKTGFLLNYENDSIIIQEFWHYGSAGHFSRRAASTDSSWSNWVKAFDNEQIVPIANGGTGASTAANAYGALVRHGGTVYDLNDALGNGVYYINGSGNHIPEAGSIYGNLLVLNNRSSDADGTICQILTKSDNKLHFRNRSGSPLAWGAWKQIWSSNDKLLDIATITFTNRSFAANTHTVHSISWTNTGYHPVALASFRLDGNQLSLVGCEFSYDDSTGLCTIKITVHNHMNTARTISPAISMLMAKNELT